MKFNKLLTINNKAVKVQAWDIRKAINSPGRALFTIEKPAKTKELVVFSCAWSNTNNTITPVFFGFVESCIVSNNKQYHIFCRELCAVFASDCLLALRRTSCKIILEQITKKNGLNFIINDAALLDKSAAYFYNLSSGFHALDKIGRVFNIKDYFWQQQDASVYLGDWNNSKYKKAGLITLPNKILTKHQINNTAQILAIPKLQPGVLINRGYIIATQLKAHKMVITWNKSLSAF